MIKLEGFLCAVYGKLRIKDVNIVCFMKIVEICGDKEDKSLTWYCYPLVGEQ